MAHLGLAGYGSEDEDEEEQQADGRSSEPEAGAANGVLPGDVITVRRGRCDTMRMRVRLGAALRLSGQHARCGSGVRNRSTCRAARRQSACQSPPTTHSTPPGLDVRVVLSTPSLSPRAQTQASAALAWAGLHPLGAVLAPFPPPPASSHKPWQVLLTRHACSNGTVLLSCTPHQHPVVRLPLHAACAPIGRWAQGALHDSCPRKPAASSQPLASERVHDLAAGRGPCSSSARLRSVAPASLGCHCVNATVCSLHDLARCRDVKHARAPTTCVLTVTELAAALPRVALQEHDQRRRRHTVAQCTLCVPCRRREARGNAVRGTLCAGLGPRGCHAPLHSPWAARSPAGVQQLRDAHACPVARHGDGARRVPLPLRPGSWLPERMALEAPAAARQEEEAAIAGWAGGAGIGCRPCVIRLG